MRLPLYLLAFATAAQAAPLPSPLFSDHAVLQRGASVPVWGTATPGEKISIAYRDFKTETTADSAGKWKATLPPMEAGSGADLVITGQGTFKASDIAVGDVWICSGQSNMEYPVETSDDFDAVKAAADKPWLRELKIPHFPAQEPQAGFKANWKVCTPREVGKYSAVAYQFVSQLYPKGDVPVGILNLSYGGTLIEPWMSPDALADSAHGKAVQARWDKDASAYPALQAVFEKEYPLWEARQKEAQAAGKKFAEKPPAKPPGRPGHYTQPSALYFGMVTPVQGFPVKGFVWYQGESNILRPEEYDSLLSGMIKDVRKKWAEPSMPFFVVQLPLFDERKLPNQLWSQVREAQARAVDSVPDAHLAVIVDIGNPINKHPTNKTEVGRRLSLLARRAVFGEKIAAESPTVKKIQPAGAGVEIQFETQGVPLALKGQPAEKRAFELAGGDGVFHPAKAELKGTDTVVLTAAEVKAPREVRYLQYDFPTTVLFTKEGLPARPFAAKVGG